jgi:thiol-disulfide isomerase/thioredoxin
MDRPRLIPFVKVIGLLLLVQAGIFLLWRLVEDRRSPAPGTPPAYERIEGKAASDLELEQADGSSLRLSAYRGRWVLLHFWATWCPPCRTELPALLTLGRRLQKEADVVLLAVVVQEPWNVVRLFFDGALPREVVRDRGGDGHTRYGVATLPETFFLSPDGRVVLRFAGAREWGQAAASVLTDEMRSASTPNSP